MSWGDEIDEELQQKQDYKVGFLLSFKSMTNAINLITETQHEWDDKHPRDSFRRIWLGDMLMLLIFFCLTYNVLAIASLPFIGFYSFVLIKLAKAYKSFGYKRTGYWWTTAGGLLIAIAIAVLVQQLIMG